jgi:hypothetical protein
LISGLFSLAGESGSLSLKTGGGGCAPAVESST